MVLFAQGYVFCRLEEYAGALANFEVLDFLRSRGAGKDPTRLIAAIAPSEYKVGVFIISLKRIGYFALLWIWPIFSSITAGL